MKSTIVMSNVQMITKINTNIIFKNYVSLQYFVVINIIYIYIFKKKFEEFFA